MGHLPKLIWLYILFLVSEQPGNAQTSEKPIVVVIPSYENKDWYQRNLDSVLTQNYGNFRVIYIDDASPDGTGALVTTYLQEKNAQNKVTIIHNPSRLGALANVYQGIWLCDPHEIVANLDGDDWFPHDHVLSKLDEVYSDPDVWATYGQFVYYPCGTPGWAAEVPLAVIENNTFREKPWITTALRTFYAGLFHKIQIEDLLFQGEFFQMAGDLAYMWPIVEMASHHSRFIPDVLYVYNIRTPLNDYKTNLGYQKVLEKILRLKPPYLPVENPYD